MFCSNCGANNKDGVKFCSACGAQLIQAQSASQQNTANTYAQPQPGQPVNPYAQPQPSQPVNPYAQPQPSQPVNPYAQPQPGQPVNPYAQPQMNQTSGSYAQSQTTSYGAKMTKKEFLNQPANESMRKTLNIETIFFWVFIILGVVVDIAQIAEFSGQGYDLVILKSGELMSMDDFTAMAIGMHVLRIVFLLLAHLKLNFVCAILFVIAIFAPVAMGSMGAIALGIFAVFYAIHIYKINQKYQTYLQTGVIG